MQGTDLDFLLCIFFHFLWCPNKCSARTDYNVHHPFLRWKDYEASPHILPLPKPLRHFGNVGHILYVNWQLLSDSCSAAYLKKKRWPHSSSWQTYSRSQSFQIIIAHKTSPSESCLISLPSTFATELHHFFWGETANLMSSKISPDGGPTKLML